MESLKKYIIIVILILFITSCTSKTSGTKTKEIDVRVGFNGLVMEFLKNTPPQRAFEDSTFPVIVKVKNNGAFSLDRNNKAILSLGVEKDYTKSVQLIEGGRVGRLGGSDNIASFNLEGKSKINTKGEEEAISYSVRAGKIDPQSEVHTSTVTAVLCYPYETILDSAVCVDTDVSNIIPGKKVCKVQDLTLGNGQGAPVAVTKVEVSMLPAQSDEQDNTQQDTQKIVPQFLLFIENRGQGTVIKKESTGEFCIKSGTTHKNLNIILVSAFLGKEELDCTPKDNDNKDVNYALVKLKDKKELARCTLKKDSTIISQDAYLSPLRIMLSYGYTQSISANYFIQKIAR